MNDRFRFRVWNKENKEMIYNAEIAYDGMNYNTSWQIGKNINDGWVDCFGYYLDYPEDYEVMQCTGLKDKNGKLIYEGDIVKINTHYNHLVCDDYEYDCESEKGYSLFKIIYDDDMARFGAERIKYVKWETPRYSLDYVPHNHKVIGNIYENKELLNEVEK